VLVVVEAPFADTKDVPVATDEVATPSSVSCCVMYPFDILQAWAGVAPCEINTDAASAAVSVMFCRLDQSAPLLRQAKPGALKSRSKSQSPRAYRD
jgi:hypothetical protein